MLGGLAGYWLGTVAMDTLGQWVIDSYGYQEQFDNLSDKFRTEGFLAVFAAALTPIPYKLVTITAGACQVALSTFIIASVVGRGARFFSEGVLIYYFGEPIRSFIDRYLNILAVLFMVLLVAGVIVVKKFL